MEDDPHSDEEILEILKMKKVAVVGMSKNPDKAAHYVPKYLHDNGYDITPVNPNADVILKKQCYDEITDVPDDVDIVDVFRPSDQVMPIIKEAIKKKPKNSLEMQELMLCIIDACWQNIEGYPNV